MLDNYKIYAGTWLTNAVKNAYYPISYACLESWSNTEFVDGVIVANGQSIDDTSEVHADIPKLDMFMSHKWNTDELGMPQVTIQLNDLIQYINDKNEDCLLILYCADVVYTDEFRIELENNCKKLINDQTTNFCRLPFAKALSLNAREVGRPYPHNKFQTYSIIKFDKNNRWTRIHEEKVLIGNSRAVGMPVVWKHPALCYETWFHTREMMLRKQRHHLHWNKSWTFDQLIDHLYIKKLKRFGKIAIERKDHPPEVQKYFDMLNSEHLGFSLFGRCP